MGSSGIGSNATVGTLGVIPAEEVASALLPAHWLSDLQIIRGGIAWADVFQQQHGSLISFSSA